MTWERCEGETIQSSSPLFLELLIERRNCSSIAVMPPRPLCISMEEILGQDHMWKCRSMQGLGSDRALTLCISWKDYLYYLSTRLRTTDVFYDDAKSKKETPKIGNKSGKRICVYTALGSHPRK